MAKARYTKRPDGRWETKVWDGTYRKGHKHYVTLYSTKSSRDLEQKKLAYETARQQGKITVKSVDSVAAYAKKWLKIYKAPREKNTYAMYENIINKHLGIIGRLTFEQLNHSLIQELVNDVLDKPRICQQLVLTMKQVVRAAERDRLLPRGASLDLFADLALPKYTPTEKRALTAQEKDAISRADLTDRERAFVLTIFYTGVRRGEALALTKKDLSFSTHMLSITKAVAFDKNDPYIKSPKSENGVRDIPMPPGMVKFMRRYLAQLPGDMLFCKLNGEPMTKSSYDKMWASIQKKLTAAYQKAWEAEQKASGVDLREAGEPDWGTVGFEDLTAHVFRHNYCTSLCYQMIQGGRISFKKIAELLGDTEKMVMEVYNHIIEEQEDASGVVAAAVNL